MLLGRTLAYSDGVLLWVCAYQLGDSWHEYSAESVEALARSVPAQPEGVVVWGRFEASREVHLNGVSHPLASFADYTPDVFDVAVDLASFSYSTFDKARLARNAAANRGVRVGVRRLDWLQAEHLALIHSWRQTHDVAPLLTSWTTALPALIRAAGTVVVEARDPSGALQGFAVVSLPTPQAAVLVQAFLRKGTGNRAGDAIYAATIELLMEQGVRRLHLGYSETESLLRFKRKWGAAIDGPPYRVACHTRTEAIAAAAKSGRLPWGQRL